MFIQTNFSTHDFSRPIKLVVAKCFDQTPSRNYLSMPRTEPVRPIDPGAWVAHTAAVRGKFLNCKQRDIYTMHVLFQ